MAAFAQKLSKLAAEVLLVVLKLFLVKADIRVSGDAENTALHHPEGPKQAGQTAEQNGLRPDEPQSLRHQQIGGQALRHRHDAHGLAALFVLQQSRRIERLVDEMGHRMVRTNENGGEDGQDLVLKKPIAELGFLPIQLLHGQVLNAGQAQLLSHRLKDLRFHGQQPRHGAVDPVELLRRGEAGFVVGFLRGDPGNVKKAAHPNHEKLVQIAGEDGDEFQPLQGWNRGVCRLLQDPPIKTEPAQFSVLGVVVALLSIF